MPEALADQHKHVGIDLWLFLDVGNGIVNNIHHLVKLLEPFFNRALARFNPRLPPSTPPDA
jgi:hypothetical protein